MKTNIQRALIIGATAVVAAMAVLGAACSGAGEAQERHSAPQRPIAVQDDTPISTATEDDCLCIAVDGELVAQEGEHCWCEAGPIEELDIEEGLLPGWDELADDPMIIWEDETFGDEEAILDADSIGDEGIILDDDLFGYDAVEGYGPLWDEGSLGYPDAYPDLSADSTWAGGPGDTDVWEGWIPTLGGDNYESFSGLEGYSSGFDGYSSGFDSYSSGFDDYPSGFDDYPSGFDFYSSGFDSYSSGFDSYSSGFE